MRKILVGRIGKIASGRSGLETEVPLQVTIPPRVERALDQRAVETDRTRRAPVLEALRHVGIDVTNEDVAGHRGKKM